MVRPRPPFLKRRSAGLDLFQGVVESALHAVPGVRDAAVRVHDPDGGRPRLVAYVVTDSTEPAPLGDSDLRKALRDRLPAYMTPSLFVHLPALPLTRHGKVDDAALPDPAAAAADVLSALAGGLTSMARPTDWDILGLDHDPAPGDPGRVKDISGRMRDIGDEAERAARDVRGLAGDDAVMGWIGASGNAFRTHIGKFPSQLDKVATSHHLCADALLEFSGALDSYQSQADRALVQARPLHDQVQRLQAQLASAHTDLTSAGKSVSAVQIVAAVDPTIVQNAVRKQTTAQSAVDSLNAQLSGPAAQLEALKKLATSAESLRHTAEDTAHTKIHAATDAGIPPDSMWHKLGKLGGELWHGLVIVAKVVSFVGAVVLMVVGGPVWLVVAVSVAGMIVFADTVNKCADGKASLWQVGLAFLSCIPITKGITSMGAVANAFREGGMIGAGAHIAGAVGGAAKDLLAGMSGLLKGGFGKAVGIAADGTKSADPFFAHQGNMPLSEVDRLFPGLRGVNVNYFKDWTWQENCQSCVRALDNLLSGKTPVTAEPVPLRGLSWPFSVTQLAGGKPFVTVPDYASVAHDLLQAGDGARGIMWGRRFTTDPLDGSISESAGHVFNVINKYGVVYFLDGQTGGLARLENYGQLNFLRTN